jgi:hypothetical protein
MDENVQAALNTYGEYLDGTSKRMNETIIQAIKTIREYVYLRNPDNQEIHHAIITAKRKNMSGAELESLVKQEP